MAGVTALVGTFLSASSLSLLYASRRLPCVVALEIGFDVGATFWASALGVRSEVTDGPVRFLERSILRGRVVPDFMGTIGLVGLGGTEGRKRSGLGEGSRGGGNS